MNAKLKMSFWIALFFMVTIGAITTNIYTPGLPAIGKYFLVGHTLVQLTITLYLLSFSIMQIFYGPLSDRFGRKKILLVGFSISLVGSFFCLIATNILILLFGRMLQGFGLAAARLLYQAILKDLFVREQQSYYASRLGSIEALVSTSALMLGGALQFFLHWRWGFVFLFVYNLFALLACKRLDETNLHPTKISLSSLIKNYLYLLKNKTFMMFALCGASIFAAFMAFFLIAPYLLEEIVGLNPFAFGFIAIPLGFGFFFGGKLNSWFVKKIGQMKMLVLGQIFLCLGTVIYLFFAFFQVINTFSVVFPMTLVSIGMGIDFPNFVVLAISPFAKITGMAVGLYGSILTFGGVIGSTVMAYAPDDSLYPLALIFLFFVLLIIFLLSQIKKVKI